MELLKIENISKQYAGHKALENISIQIKKGEIFGLLGPNGAGKTSLIRIINQITGPDEGVVYLNGNPITQKDISKIGYLPEERGLYKKMRVYEQVLYFAQLKGLDKTTAKQKINYWFEKFDITSWYSKKVEELSKGMAQKIQFIITVLHEPEFLILDEPFSGFDPINAQIIRNEILELKKNGTSILLSTHNMNSVEEICDSIALINESKLVLHGELDEVKNRFKTNTYVVHFKGHLLGFANALFASFALEHSEQITEETAIAHVKLLHGNSLNDLLKTIIPVVEIISVNEVLPTMNEIFISAVNKKGGGEDE